MSGGKGTLSISADMSGLHEFLNQLGDTVDEAVRPAAQVAAEVLYREVKKNVASLGRVTGNLDNSIYQVYSKDNSDKHRATYHVSWNHRKAPHGHLVEYGHVQRYATYLGKDGRWHTAIRPEAKGMPKPKRNASQAEKDAYYVPLKGGPRHVGARPFIRNAQSAFSNAADAAEADLLKRILESKK